MLGREEGLERERGWVSLLPSSSAKLRSFGAWGFLGLGGTLVTAAVDFDGIFVAMAAALFDSSSSSSSSPARRRKFLAREELMAVEIG